MVIIQESNVQLTGRTETENGWTETGNREKWRTTERNGLWRETENKWIETGNREKRRRTERNGVALNGNGRMGQCCGVVRMCRECDRLVWNVVEGCNQIEVSRNGAGVTEVDLTKFYVT